MNYQEVRAYIADAEKYGSVLGLANMKELMGRLGNPQDRLRVVHVAGTNGKGSVIAFLYSVLNRAGIRTGRYVSPPLYCYRERLEAEGNMISREEFASAASQVIEACCAMEEEGLTHPTTFEIETAAAFCYFAEKDLDLVLIEVGMGGSLDATNILKSPVLSVLVSISMDHMAFLGNTLAEIAEKKAGIIKPGCPVVTVKQPSEAEEAIRSACGSCGALMHVADPAEAQVLDESVEGQTFRYRGEEYRIPLSGVHQIENAVLALEALELLDQAGYHTTREDRKEGLAHTIHRGRFMILCRKPLFIVDGAHNPGAADALARSVEQYLGGRRIIFIIGMFRDKDYPYVLRRMCPFAEHILTIQTPDNARALPAQELAEAARAYHRSVEAMESIPAAVKRACELAGPEDVILSFGSLSFIGALTEVAENDGLAGMQTEN